jgi:hypothetical protein
MDLTLRNSDPVLEFSRVDLHDRRLNRRCATIAAMLQKSPSESLPSLCANDSELAATYRFFNNSSVTPAALLAPHIEATVVRAAQLREVLVIHDTTEASYLGGRSDLGPLSGKQRGFLAHCSLAVTADGAALPLGVLATEFLTRKDDEETASDKKKRKKGHKAKYSLGPENEGSRWERAAALVEKTLGGRVSAIHIEDREGDSYLLLSEMVAHDRRFVVRLTHDRVLTSTDQSVRKLFELMAQMPVVTTRGAKVSARSAEGRPPAARRKHPPREQRLAELSVSASRVSLKKPHGAPRTLPAQLDVNVVRVFEPNPPAGEEPVEWFLVTTEPVETEAQLLRVIDFYRRRWLIEEFFLAMKSGCSVEERAFERGDALKNIFTMTMPIAWQMLLLRAFARDDEHAAATKALTATQVMLLVLATRKLPPRQRPSEQPSSREALKAIAALGGHLTRNGEPGWLTIARGFRELRKLVQGFQLALEVPALDVTGWIDSAKCVGS